MKPKNLDGLMKKLNPFIMRDERLEPFWFEDYGKCYLATLSFIKERYPRGFIDVPLLLHQLTQYSLSETERMVQEMNFIQTDRGIYLLGWEDKENNPKRKAELLLRSLHQLSETTFSVDFFNWAWGEFCIKYNISS